MFIFLSYYMQGVLHYSALKAGIAFLPFAIGIVVGAAASTALVPRIGPRIPMSAGMLVGAIGLGWLTQIGVDTSFWGYVFGPQVLMSVGLGFAFPALSSTALTNVDDRDSGVASALINTTQQIGGSLGTALLNTVAATATAGYIAVHGRSFVPEGLVHGYSVAFAVGAVPPRRRRAGHRGARRRPLHDGGVAGEAGIGRDLSPALPAGLPARAGR